MGTASISLLAVLSVVVVLVSESITGWWLVLLAALIAPWVLLGVGVRLAPRWFVVGQVVGTTAFAFHGTQGTVFLLLFLLLWLGTVSLERATTLVVAIAAVVVSAISAVASEHGLDKGALYFTLGAVLAGACSELMRSQRRLVSELTMAREELGHRAADVERARIAREIHDVVGHSLTVVQLHLAGARRQLASDPAKADATLAVAEDIGRESLDHLRQVVGLLRSADGTSLGASAPMPAAGDVPALVDAARDAGLDVSLTIDGDLADVEPAVGLCAYRVVQESLANARHHAPGAPVQVAMKVQRCQALDVVVANPITGGEAGRGQRNEARQGSGLLGMRERAAACHGSLSVGPRESSWVVKLRVPLAVTR